MSSAVRTINRPMVGIIALALGPLIALPARAAEPDAANLPPPAARPVDFTKDIQPLLANHCHRCHGEQRAEADLRWDLKASALAGSDHGPVLVAGNSAASRMIHLVAGLDPKNVMPKKGERLNAEQVGLLRAWIDQGAAWPESLAGKPDAKREHWAFKTPVRPRVPGISKSVISESVISRSFSSERRPDAKTDSLITFSSNPIDAFIAARLEKEGLRFSPEADRATLIRRLSLDLLGLPPTLAEIDAFLADASPDAYARLVERLLASPHYGERWGRHWLDAARYADSNGYEKDAGRSIWPYRDYVIQALNRDLPFDQFTVEQLAGDLLPNPTLDQRVATGFLRNSMMNQEGGIEPEQFRIDAMIDRMDAVGRTWLGLTIACAQCHNHKYDPLTQKEYYQLFAFLNNDDDVPTIEVPTPEQQKQREEVRVRVRKLEDKALDDSTNLVERLAAWEKSIADAAGNWTVLDPVEWHNFATKYEEQSDHSLLGGGDIKPYGVTHVWFDTALTNITGFRLEVLMHPSLPYGGPGLTARGSFLLREITGEVYASKNPTVTNQVKFLHAYASAEAPGFAVTNAIDGNTEKGGWTSSAVPVEHNEEARAVFECAEPIAGFPGGTRLKISVHQKHSTGEGWQIIPDKDTGLDCHTFGRFRVSATTAAARLQADPLTAAQRKLLAKPAAQRTPDERRELFNIFRRTEPSMAAISKSISDSWTNWVYAPTTLGLSVRTEPRATRVFKRGDWQKPAAEVQPDVPAWLHPWPADAPRNRLGLARWIVDRRSPTTARVIVNRVWQAYFGQGLFTTPEDIGTRVDPPSHPELLDWLACEFMEPIANASRNTQHATRSTDHASPPWSLKHLHRLIVTSATYKQSSRVTPELYERDAYNRLLARGPRFRVEGEVVQDIALFASGLLNPKIGGPSVHPPIPGNVADQVYGGFRWTESTGEDRYRRGLYTYWKRALPFPAMLAFDAPPAEVSCTRRVRSNTPLQALVTLNEKTFVEAAQAMGLRVLKEGGADNAARVRHAFRLATGRAPTERESQALLSFWDEQYRYFEDRTADALQVALPDLKTIPPQVNLHKVAAWAMVSRAILNLDETFTKE
jgi:mono/diheme cytochrome c family protein